MSTMDSRCAIASSSISGVSLVMRLVITHVNRASVNTGGGGLIIIGGGGERIGGGGGGERIGGGGGGERIGGGGGSMMGGGGGGGGEFSTNQTKSPLASFSTPSTFVMLLAGTEMRASPAP